MPEVRPSNWTEKPDPEDYASAFHYLSPKRGKLLSPVLCLRGDLHTGALLTIADGYHRVCASYLLDEGADIPCRLAELPRREGTLAEAITAQGHTA